MQHPQSHQNLPFSSRQTNNSIAKRRAHGGDLFSAALSGLSFTRLWLHKDTTSLPFQAHFSLEANKPSRRSSKLAFHSSMALMTSYRNITRFLCMSSDDGVCSRLPAFNHKIARILSQRCTSGPTLATQYQNASLSCTRFDMSLQYYSGHHRALHGLRRLSERASAFMPDELLVNSSFHSNRGCRNWCKPSRVLAIRISSTPALSEGALSHRST
jgi:hypothetical protein